MLLCRCVWCDRQFRLRTGGGKLQRFCTAICRRSCEAASRAWMQQALATGLLTIVGIQSALGATRALQKTSTESVGGSSSE
jgi:hypothetical protein